MNDGKTDKAVLALIFGIASLALCYVPFVGLIAGILAIVISGLYFKSGEKEKVQLVTAGRACGIIGLILSLVVLAAGVVKVIAALA